MSKEEMTYLQQWISKAEEDLLVVHQLMNADILVKGAIAYHCQQSAEKFLKAFLVFHGNEIPKTHNIEFLLEKCKIIDKSFSAIDVYNLTDYGVEVRYPGDFLEPSLKEIQTLIPIIENIRDRVLLNLQAIPPRNQ
ncbi:MAG: HEPN domain-containing protein [Bacteroidales bacterium]|jgi:HEPN domain-containing protein|nr:HEPN domain-containing protein [Bacteroidales bacterium]